VFNEVDKYKGSSRLRLMDAYEKDEEYQGYG